MSNMAIVSSSKIVAIADAIRAKTSSFEGLTLDQMPFAIDSIRVGGGDDLASFTEGTLVEIKGSFNLIREYAFNYLTSLETVNAQGVSRIGQRAFYGCTSLKSATFGGPVVIDTFGMRGISYLETVDFSDARTFGVNSFLECYSLKTVIIRTNSVCSILNVNAFNKCWRIMGEVDATYNPNGVKDGYFYVPRYLVDSYKMATNWTAYADQIRAIEDYPEITGGL